MQVRYDVAGCIQVFDARLLMFINPQTADVVASCSQHKAHLGADGATEGRIEEVNLYALPIRGIHVHSICSR